MSWWRNFEEWLEQKAYPSQTPEPRNVTTDDRAGWFEAATRTPPKEYSIERVREEMKWKNPVRWGRIQREFKWLQKQMRKAGYNPDDARWIL